MPRVRTGSAGNDRHGGREEDRVSTSARRSEPTAGRALPVPAVRVSPERAQAARSTMEALAATPDVFATFFDSAAIGLALADLSGRYVRVNAVYADLLGREPEDLIGVPFASVVHPEDRDDDDSAVALREGARTRIEREQRYLHADGRMHWVLHGVTVVPAEDGQPAWFAVSAQDITERRRAEQELRELAAALSEQAVRDPLTGLANRTLLQERLRAALSRDARSHGGTGLLFLDLDGFKAVNDRHGHAVGDTVLREVARRLTATVRPSDTVARLGGDEFVVLVEAGTEDDLAPVVQRLSAAFEQPLAAALADTPVGVSIGTAWVQGGDSTPDELLRRADADMYREKRGRA
jgi:diguanylate cyclase (GGDEF)-like protein/PAS domain S-box-containing protein